MDAVLIIAVLVMVVLSVILMTRSQSPTWWLWPWRLHWSVWVVLGVLWAVMMLLY
jgi:hypothetical protein